MKPRARGSSLHPLRRYWWEPQLELGNKNSLVFASDTGSLVVIGRFRDFGITESVMSSSHLILCCPLFSCPQSLPASNSFPMSQLFT